MKQLILIITIITFVLLSPSSRAELIIYKGIEQEINSSANNGLPINWKVFVIVDHDTGYYARIRYATISGAKLYRTLVHTNTHFVEVVGADAKTYTVITDIPTPCQAQEFPGVEAVSLKGLNASLKISANSTVMFPKVLSVAGVGLSHSAGGAPILDEIRFTLVFNSAQTLASNAAGESLDAAFSRLIADVQSLGY